MRQQKRRPGAAKPHICRFEETANTKPQVLSAAVPPPAEPRPKPPKLPVTYNLQAFLHEKSCSAGNSFLLLNCQDATAMCPKQNVSVLSRFNFCRLTSELRNLTGHISCGFAANHSSYAVRHIHSFYFASTVKLNLYSVPLCMMYGSRKQALPGVSPPTPLCIRSTQTSVMSLS